MCIRDRRTEAGYEVTDRIQVRCQCGEKLAAAIETGREMIMRGALALSLTREAPAQGWIAKEWDIIGEMATIAIRK